VGWTPEYDGAVSGSSTYVLAISDQDSTAANWVESTPNSANPSVYLENPTDAVSYIAFLNSDGSISTELGTPVLESSGLGNTVETYPYSCVSSYGNVTFDTTSGNPGWSGNTINQEYSPGDNPGAAGGFVTNEQILAMIAKIFDWILHHVAVIMLVLAARVGIRSVFKYLNTVRKFVDDSKGNQIRVR